MDDGQWAVHTFDIQLFASRLSMLSRAPPLGWCRPANILKGLPKAHCCHESSLDLERETKRKARGTDC